MGKTIIQTIGPLYGDVVNGTVFGRPNGSIYVPGANKITLNIGAEYVMSGPEGVSYEGWIVPATAGGVLVPSAVSIIAESQDIAAYVGLQFSDDEDFATYDENTEAAGRFNILRGSIINFVSQFTVAAGDPYYVRAVLSSQSGVAVAYSEVVTLTGVVAS